MNGVIFLLFSGITKVLALLPAVCVCAGVCSGDAKQHLILVQKNGREDKNGFPKELETVEVEKLKQKEKRANHLHCKPSVKEKQANPGHPATDAQIPRGGASCCGHLVNLLLTNWALPEVLGEVPLTRLWNNPHLRPNPELV